METAGKANYFAFVSHKSADRDFAMKVKRFMEKYKLPESVRRETNLPKRLGAVCCYEDDFSTNPLKKEMEEKLRQSQFLIVICSKDREPGGSQYVNFEIETFIKQKQEEGIDPLERIIPIIVSGVFDSETEECCPAALKALGENRPIAADCRKYKNDREVFLHAISGMLNIDYAVLVNKDKQRRKTIASVVCGVSAAAMLIGGIILYYFVPKQWHYVDFVMQNGLPVGIGRLTEREYQSMNSHYMITTQRGKITKLEHVNAKGTLVAHEYRYRTDRPAKQVFNYDSNGLSSVTYYDEYEQAYFVMNYYKDDLSGVDLRESGNGNGIYFLGTGYSYNPEKLLKGTGYMDVTLKASSDPYSGTISRFSYTYNEKGFVTKVLFYADSSNKRVTDHGVFGFEYELDDLGRIRKVYYLDILQNRISNTKDIYCTEYVYDDSYNLVALKHFNAKGNLEGDENGIKQLRWTYDKKHNCTMLEVLDGNGNPVMDKNVYIAATKKYVYDDEGNLLLSSDFSADGGIFTLSGGFNSYEYDKNGRMTKRTTLEKGGTPYLFPSLGYAVITYERDAQGRVIGQRYYDVDGKTPASTQYGYAYKETAYHSSGSISKIAYYDTAGNPVNHSQYGYSVELREYDSLGRGTVISYWGANQAPASSTGPDNFCGFHKCVLEYEDQLNGFSKKTQTFYDTNDNITNCAAYEDIDPYAIAQMIAQNGYVTYSVIYNQDNVQVGTRFESSRSFNVRGELEETAKYFQSDGTMSLLETTVYDGRGIRKQFHYESQGDEKLLIGDISYQENNKIAKETFQEYDLNNNLIRESYAEYDINGNEVLYNVLNNEETNYHRLEVNTKYNGTVKTESNTLIWNNEGEPVSVRLTKYDDRGRQAAESGIYYENYEKTGSYTREHIYQEDGSFAIEHIAYNKDNEQVSKSISYYGSDGKLISHDANA